MALTRKPTKRKTTRPREKPERPAPDTHEMIARLDAMIRDLQAMRQELADLPPAEPRPKPNLVEELFGALGRGTWDEYDLNLDWVRFGE